MGFGISLLAHGTTGLLAGAAAAPAAVFAVQTELSLVTSLPVARVYFRQEWQDEWVINDDVHVESVRKTVGSDIGTATLTYEYGRVMADGDATFTQRNPLDKNGWWVKIVFDPQQGRRRLNDDPPEPVYWVGVVTRDQRDRMGAPEGTLNGNQTLTCSSIEWLLSRTQVRWSTIVGPAGYATIQRGLPFNGADSVQHRGEFLKGANRSDNQTADHHYVFRDNPQYGNLWSAADMVHYLLKTQELFLGGGQEVPSIRVDAELNNMLGWYFPRQVETHGRALYELLNTIIHPQFGVTWSVEYEPVFDSFVLVVHSYSATNITLPDTRVFRRNEQPIYVDLDQDNTMDAIEIRDVANRYSQVVVQGALRGSVFTLSTADFSLRRKASSEEVESYMTAAGDLSGGALTRDMQIATHDNYRSSDKLRHVFSTFVIPSNWQGNVSTTPGDHGSAVTPAFPLLDLNGDPTSTPSFLSNESLRLAPVLPLREGITYSADVTTTQVAFGYNQTPGFMKPFVVWKLRDDFWAYGDKMSSYSYANSFDIVSKSGLAKKASVGFDVELELLEHEAGVRVQPTGMSHLIAATEWNASTTKQPSFSAAVLNTADMAVTVYATQDDYVEAKYPDTPTNVIADQYATLTLRLGDRAKLDYVVPGTIIGINSDGTLRRATNGGFVRDDRGLLANVARMAWQWYQQDRVSLRIGMQQINGSFRIGDLVTQIGSGDVKTTVNSLVTALDWDFKAGRTSVTTSYTDELDVSVLV